MKFIDSSNISLFLSDNLSWHTKYNKYLFIHLFSISYNNGKITLQNLYLIIYTHTKSTRYYTKYLPKKRRSSFGVHIICFVTIHSDWSSYKFVKTYNNKSTKFLLSTWLCHVKLYFLFALNTAMWNDMSYLHSIVPCDTVKLVCTQLCHMKRYDLFSLNCFFWVVKRYD